MSILFFIFEIIVFALVICAVVNEEKIIKFEDLMVKVIKIKHRNFKRNRAKKIQRIKKIQYQNTLKKEVA